MSAHQDDIEQLKAENSKLRAALLSVEADIKNAWGDRIGNALVTIRMTLECQTNSLNYMEINRLG